MSEAENVGWADRSPNDPEVVKLRDHLEASNGITDLKTYKQDDMEGILKAFHRDGFVVVTDVLSPDQIDLLQSGCTEVVNEVMNLDEALKGNRGSHRYSFGE